MRIAVLNGPNLNLLGRREPELYGRETLQDIETRVRSVAGEVGVDIDWFQSNHEGALIDAVQGLPGRADGAIVNAGALTHSSLGLRDAFLAVKVPFVEVHLSNLFARDMARQHTVLGDLALGFICGFGADGYLLALRALAGKLR